MKRMLALMAVLVLLPAACCAFSEEIPAANCQTLNEKNDRAFIWIQGSELLITHAATCVMADAIAYFGKDIIVRDHPQYPMVCIGKDFNSNRIHAAFLTEGNVYVFFSYDFDQQKLYRLMPDQPAPIGGALRRFCARNAIGEYLGATFQKMLDALDAHVNGTGGGQ